MSKIRVYELAKELSTPTTKVQSKEIIQKAKALGIFVENHLSQLTETEGARLRKAIQEAQGGDGQEKRVRRTVIRRRRGTRTNVVPPGEKGAEGTEEAEEAPAAAGKIIRRRRKATKAEEDTSAKAEETAEKTAENEAAETPEPQTTQKEETSEQPAEATPAEEAPAEETKEDSEDSQPAAAKAEEATEEPEAPLKDADSEQSQEAVDGQEPTPETTPEVAEASPEEPQTDEAPKEAEVATPDRPAPKQPARKKKNDKYKAVVVAMPENPPPADPTRPKVSGLPPKPSTKVIEKEERENRRRRGKKLIYDRRREGGGGRFGGGRRGHRRKKKKKASEATLPEKSQRQTIKIEDTITVGELAQQMFIKASMLLKKLMEMGMMSTVNDTLDYETAALICEDLGYEVENVSFDVEQFLETQPDKDDELVPRPPVVTIMGHVDHGKTSLLDRIQASDLAGAEAGGITQTIGAYVVKVAKGQVTFIDTPGHEAFTAMRARGAMVTDMVILVVAADDGVMPQTVEAINHAKAADVPIIVAVNKIDKPGCDPAKVRRELSEHELLPEDWGGDTIFVDLSAKTGENIDTLLEMLVLQAEVLELKANPKKRAKGTIIESRLEKGRGPVATVVVQEGTLKVGDTVVAGGAAGRIRALMDDRGRPVKSVRPSYPAEILGLDRVPNASEELYAVRDEKTARTVGDYRDKKDRDEKLAKQIKPSFDELFSQMGDAASKELKVVLKGDSQGSVEAIHQGMEQLSTDQVKLEVIHEGVGTISETDVNLAQASDGLILGFNVKPDPIAKSQADAANIQILSFTLIHELLDKTRLLMEGKLDLIEEEKYLGKAEIRQVFAISRLGKIAGCMVLEGKIQRAGFVRLKRNGEELWKGKLASLKRFKEDSKEVAQGFECGMNFEGFNNIREGDVVESYEIIKVAAKLAD